MRRPDGCSTERIVVANRPSEQSSRGTGRGGGAHDQLKTFNFWSREWFLSNVRERALGLLDFISGALPRFTRSNFSGLRLLQVAFCLANGFSLSAFGGSREACPPAVLGVRTG